MKGKKPKILTFIPKKSTFSEKIKILKKNYTLKNFTKSKDLLSAVLFDPPKILIYYLENESKLKLLETLLNLKQNFNLVSMGIMLIIERENLKSLLAEEILWKSIDDFLFSQADEEELMLRVKIGLHRQERIADNNPLTGLPGNVSIEHALRRALESNELLTVAYVDLDNFKAYNDLYGFSAGDEVIKNLARILQTTIFEKSPKSFIGHIGGDDFIFIIPSELTEEICQGIIKKFNLLLPAFLKEEDLKRGYFICKNRAGELCKIPLLSVSIAGVPIKKGKFKHPGEVASRAAQVKSYVKSLPGSNYFIDRRE